MMILSYISFVFRNRFAYVNIFRRSICLLFASKLLQVIVLKLYTTKNRQLSTWDSYDCSVPSFLRGSLADCGRG